MNMFPREPDIRFSALLNKISVRLLSAWMRPVCVCAILTLTLLSPAQCIQKVNRYDQVMRLVRALSDSPNVRLLPFGRSADLCVPSIIISDFSARPEGKTRILICSGQHGNEFDAVRSVLALTCKLASESEPELLKKCAFIVVPMLNPGGVAANTRLSAENIDLNRNWRTPNSPEARHLDTIINTWRPQILIDAHEQDKPSYLEVPVCLSLTQQTAIDQMANRISIQAGVPLARAGSNKTLFHSNYTLLGYAAYLIEVDSNIDYAVKLQQYSSIILGMARSLSSSKGLSPIISPSSGKFRISAIGTYLAPNPPKPAPKTSASLVNVAMLLTVGYVLCMCLLRPFARENRQWSRRFLRCDIESFVEIDPLLSRQKNVPITSRSWVNRRLRSCYAKEEPKPEQKHQPQAVPKTEYSIVYQKPQYPKAERKQEIAIQ